MRLEDLTPPFLRPERCGCIRYAYNPMTGFESNRNGCGDRSADFRRRPVCISDSRGNVREVPDWLPRQSPESRHFPPKRKNRFCEVEETGRDEDEQSRVGP